MSLIKLAYSYAEYDAAHDAMMDKYHTEYSDKVTNAAKRMNIADPGLKSAKGAGVGALGGLAAGATLGGFLGSKVEVGIPAGILGGIVGLFAGGMLGTKYGDKERNIIHQKYPKLALRFQQQDKIMDDFNQKYGY